MNSFSFDDPCCYDRIQPYILNKIREWVEKGSPIGGFLTAVLENNLSSAIACADEYNFPAIPAIVSYLYNEVPCGCWDLLKR